MNALTNAAAFGVADPSALSSRAMLAQISIRQWSGRKLDKNVTAKTNADHGARADAGRYNKALIAKDALAEVAAVVGRARKDHEFYSLPWLQNGCRIMPAAGFQVYASAMQKHREDFESAVADFLTNYPDFVADAEKVLGDMFDRAEYPDAATIAGRFSWAVTILPLPDAADFRVTLADDEASRLRAEIASTMQEAARAAMADTWQRLYDAVSAMATKLKDYKPATDTAKADGIFRDSLVENLRDLVEILPGLNLTGDAALAAMTDKAREALTMHDAKTLRDNDGIRDDVATAAAEIADAMAAFMGA